MLIQRPRLTAYIPSLILVTLMATHTPSLAQDKAPALPTPDSVRLDKLQLM